MISGSLSPRRGASLGCGWRNGLQYGVAANILNKQSRTADKLWSSSLEFGRGANSSSAYKLALLRKGYLWQYYLEDQGVDGIIILR